jgi:hypothetical protein
MCDNYDKPKLPGINDPGAFLIKSEALMYHNHPVISAENWPFDPRKKISRYQGQSPIAYVRKTNSRQYIPVFLLVLFIREIDPDAQELAPTCINHCWCLSLDYCQLVPGFNKARRLPSLLSLRLVATSPGEYCPVAFIWGSSTLYYLGTITRSRQTTKSTIWKTSPTMGVHW